MSVFMVAIAVAICFVSRPANADGLAGDDLAAVQSACRCPSEAPCENDPSRIGECAVACTKWITKVDTQLGPVRELGEARSLELVVGLLLVLLVLVGLTLVAERRRFIGSGATALILLAPGLTAVGTGYLVNGPNAESTAATKEALQGVRGMQTTGQAGSARNGRLSCELALQQVIDTRSVRVGSDTLASAFRDYQGTVVKFDELEASAELSDEAMLARLNDATRFYGDINKEPEVPENVVPTARAYARTSPALAGAYSARARWGPIPLDSEVRFVPHLLVRLAALVLIPVVLALFILWIRSGVLRRGVR